MNKRRFTILHSNDMHGDFLAEVCGAKGELIGGLSLLSGYINQVRQEEENVLYVIAGDMLQGSIIDTEYKGISTMSIMNYLAPDVVTLGLILAARQEGRLYHELPGARRSHPGQPRVRLRAAAPALFGKGGQLSHRQRQPVHPPA